MGGSVEQRVSDLNGLPLMLGRASVTAQQFLRSFAFGGIFMLQK